MMGSLFQIVYKNAFTSYSTELWSHNLFLFYNFIRFIPLHHAALSGNGEIVMALLEFTTDVNAKDKKGLTLIEVYTHNP